MGADESVARAIYLSAHLVNTLLMLGAMVALTAWWASGHAPMRFADRSLAKLMGFAIGAALVVGVTGAIAALSDTLYPATSLTNGWVADFAASHPFICALADLASGDRSAGGRIHCTGRIVDFTSGAWRPGAGDSG